MKKDEAINDLFVGYKDGRDPQSPSPSGNRSYSYRHGFANGRDDLHGQPRAPTHELRVEAGRCISKDTGEGGVYE